MKLLQIEKFSMEIEICLLGYSPNPIYESCSWFIIIYIPTKLGERVRFRGYAVNLFYRVIRK